MDPTALQDFQELMMIVFSPWFNWLAVGSLIMGIFLALMMGYQALFSRKKSE
jgi:hypothetical protein